MAAIPCSSPDGAAEHMLAVAETWWLHYLAVLNPPLTCISMTSARARLAVQRPLHCAHRLEPADRLCMYERRRTSPRQETSHGERPTKIEQGSPQAEEGQNEDDRRQSIPEEWPTRP